MQIQHTLNSDVTMVLDECTPYKIGDRPATESEAAASMRMSLRWAKRSKDEFDRLENPNTLFGIVQGGMFNHLREESLEGLKDIGFHGRWAAFQWVNPRKRCCAFSTKSPTSFLKTIRAI